MLKDKVDHVYLINLDERTDRLESATNECNKIGLPFERVSAVNGSALNLTVQSYSAFDDLYWNAGAYGLLLTTLKILKDAKVKGYKSILILEDDVFFKPEINDLADLYFPHLPNDWQMILFGAEHCLKPSKYKGNLSLARYSFCLHCYAINHIIFDYYIHLLEKQNKQIDLITAEDLQPLMKTFVFTPDLAGQTASWSNIQERPVDSKCLRK
ncbi:glycosyl transferase [Sporocytophaga myxococcoides]|uniref:Glycosyl transferase n=1 Tax=Sporocytophaga myxococcoides TaxID=153721 RepID=A0A098LAF0_9BACT|nr:glycosyltransferase family 25 protein [Sporocytophaga myxococcoides]GAL83404.1 glycosyl transferase [Sporocytophaga myxococcoides]